MVKFSNVSMLISALLLMVLMINVTLGAMKFQVFLTDVMEMLVLFICSIFFVAAILAKEWLVKINH